MKNYTIAFGILVSCLSANLAYADCSPTSVPIGGTINCTGLHTTEVDDGSDDITINLDNTAEIIVNDGRGIDFGGDDVFVNIGENTSSTAKVISTDGDAIRIEGNNATILNFGFIDGDDEGLQADDGNGHLFDNYGHLVAADEGFNGNDNVTLFNREGASIKAIDDAVNLEENATIHNFGLIENNGTVGSSPQDALDLNSGTVINYVSGIIKSTQDSAIDFDADDGSGADIQNWGLIIGTVGIEVELGGVDPANTSNQDIDNYGSIIGTSGVAAVLGAGDDSFIWRNGSSVEGSIDLGEGIDKFYVDGPSSFMELIESDGGLGIDTAEFFNTTLDNVVKVSLLDDVLSLVLGGNQWDMEFSFKGFEQFIIGDVSYSLQELIDAKVSAPSAMFLLCLSIIGLFFTSAKRARA